VSILAQHQARRLQIQTRFQGAPKSGHEDNSVP
jgi:hypothetical protein